MYIQSEKLLERISQISKEVEIQTNHTCLFEEFVAIPFYGQIILRFQLNSDSYTIEDLDRLENMLNNISGENFLCDFMGDVYRNVGVDYSDIGKRLIKMNDKYCDESIPVSSHANGINADAQTLLKAAGLDISLPVWEIQLESNEYTLLLLGEENKKLLSISEPICLSVREVDKRACTGLIKGTFYCRRNHISLVRVLIGE